MILTQDEAKKWSEILKGFSEGKRYEIPRTYDDEGNVPEWLEITDFEVNPQCPTIAMIYSQNLTMINPDTIREVR